MVLFGVYLYFYTVKEGRDYMFYSSRSWRGDMGFTKRRKAERNMKEHPKKLAC
jgi:hypothetical protein